MFDVESGKTQVHAMAGDIGLSLVTELLLKFPELGKYMLEYGFGGIYSRTELTMREQEIASISSLVTQGAFDQLNFHFLAAFNIGMTKTDIEAIFLHSLPHIGIPKVMSAFKELEKFLEQK
jgi:4-carboxymuconolactone decarboxylase